MSENHRRVGDTMVGKIMNVWPLILSLIIFLMAAATIKAKVDDGEKRMENHEGRIINLENNMAVVRNNTDLLVERLIRKK